MVGFSLTDEQKALQELARDFAQKEIAPVAPELDKSGQYPYTLLKQAHSLGLLNLTIEEAYGGGGLGWFEACLVGEEFAAACAGVTTAANANELALTPIHLAASEEQKKKFIPPIAREGGLAAFCVTEPGAGSDVAAMRTRAVKSGDEYILNGTKHFITNGGVAELLTVFAVTDPEKKHRGMSLFAVPANLRCGKPEDGKLPRPAEWGPVRRSYAGLLEIDPELRPVLKAEGFLMRDAREKERRKYGLKKARKAPQYSKR